MAPSKVVVVAGTYEGVLAGYELNENGKLDMVCATPIHSGSVRSLAVSNQHGFVTAGYDETLKTHDFTKGVTSSGEIKTPSDYGTPSVLEFCPPLSSTSSAKSTHCLVGFDGNPASSEGGKIIIYKRRDWSLQHVLAGHEGGVASIAVHPTGKLALTGGRRDGKLKLWDLEKGRLAYATNVVKEVSNTVEGAKHYSTIQSIVWSTSEDEGDCYGFCYGNHVSVRDVATGKDRLDVELPSQANQICFMEGPEGLFVAAACNDGSLPVLAVDDIDNEQERRAVLAIEPVDEKVAGEERFKCIRSVSSYVVVVAASSGVVGLYDLHGAVKMITTPETEEEPDSPKAEADDSSDDDFDDEELAVDIIDSVLIGTGARITCLGAYAVYNGGDEGPDAVADGIPVTIDTSEKSEEGASKDTIEVEEDDKDTRPAKRKANVVLDEEAIEKARELVSKAKKIQNKKQKKKRKQKR